ncbi:MAG: energy-coupling factor transporter transmembrane protein EcfT [Microbacterium sp.]|uniref:CbiQ family ECF transporter T component n=1 Tax=Microbacterium sp. TaxID=51671 RepID=UPI003BB09047
MILLYRPGSSILHRSPAGVKLALFALAALALSVYPHDGWSIALVLVAVCALYAVARLPWRILLAEAWRLRWIVLVLGAALTIFVSPLIAWINTGRVVGIVLLASLLTLTTRMSDLLAVLHRLMRPLGRIGVDAESVAMTISLTITMIPVVAAFADRVRDAQDARGVRLGVRSAIPLLVLALRHADDVGDALAARGLA